MLRFFALVLLLAVSCQAQFSNLATTDTGDEVFLYTSLREAGSEQTRTSKIFALDEDGLHPLVEFKHGHPIHGSSPPTKIGVSGDGTLVAYDVRLPCLGGSSCWLRELSTGHLLDRGPGTETRPGPHLRISRNGRYILTWPSPGAMGSSPPAITDVTNGQSTTLEGLHCGQGSIASDGSALCAASRELFQVSPAGTIRNLGEIAVTEQRVDALTLSDSGTVAVYETLPDRRLFVLDVATGATTQLGPNDRESYGATLSNDGQWVLYLSVIGETPRLFFSRYDGSFWKQLLPSGVGVGEAALSGDGRVAWASTEDGRLLKIDTDTREVTEILAPPVIDEVSGRLVPGSLMHLHVWNMGNRIEMNGQEAPFYAGESSDIFVQVPWDLPKPEEERWFSMVTFPVVIRLVPPDGSLLESAVTRDYRSYYPAPFLDPMHEDWSGFVTPETPPRPGEVIHIYTTGLGPVDCPIETGQAAPVDRLCRPIRTIEWDYWWTSTDSMPAEILFAGLAPGLVGLYQIDAKVPEQPPANRLKLIADRYGEYVLADFIVR